MVGSYYTYKAASLLLLPSALAAGLYTSSSPVLQVDARSYDSLIAKSNHTSIVEFYAPWCGHCQNLQPAYEKAAKSLRGQAKVAAINCDDEDNKPFCGSMGVQGFPTLKIVRPGQTTEGKDGKVKRGRPVVEDYQGARSAKAIVDAVREKIPNHVRRLKDADYVEWLTENEGQDKAILFSDKGPVSALLRAVAIDFLGTISVAQSRDKELDVAEAFKVDHFPTLILVAGKDGKTVTYDGKLEKEDIVKFLTKNTGIEPNPDPAPKKEKAKSSSTNKSKASKFSKASASHASAEGSASPASQTGETLEDASNPTESPNPIVEAPNSQKPVPVPQSAPPIPSLPDGLSLQQKCLNNKAGTCILLLLPEQATAENTLHALIALSEIHHKHTQSGRNLFPFYQVPSSNSQGAALRRELGLSDSTAGLVATNAKRTWYKLYPATSFRHDEVEAWIDSLRMGEGKKEELPTKLVADAASLPAKPVEIKMEQMEEMRAKMKGSLPEGVDFEFEEIDDLEYENMMRAAESIGKEKEAKEWADSRKVKEEVEEHDEL